MTVITVNRPYITSQSAIQGMAEDIITVVGSSYYQPITDLIHRLLAHERLGATSVKRGYRENGYSSAIILLLVVSFESYIARVSYLQRQRPKGGKPKMKKTSVPDYLAQLRKSFSLQKSLTEAFVLRDVLAHNHLWTLTVSHHERRHLILRRAVKDAEFGDYKYSVAVNPKTRRTSVLGLNVVPTSVGLREVAKVFDVLWRALQFLEKAELLERAAFDTNVRYGGQSQKFWGLRNVVRAAL